MRTYAPATFLAAHDAWSDGDFDLDLWWPFREAAAERGFLYPPSGSPDDDRSQRAIVYAAIRDRPRLLLETIWRASSWAEVVAQLITRRSQHDDRR